MHNNSYQMKYSLNNDKSASVYITYAYWLSYDIYAGSNDLSSQPFMG